MGLQQTITIKQFDTFKLGVTKPYLVSGSATSGLPLSYSLVSGPATLTDKILTPNAVGTVVIEITQSGNADYDPADPVQRSFDVVDATKYEIAEAVLKLKDSLDVDIQSSMNINKFNIDQISEISFKILPDGSGSVEIDGSSYPISDQQDIQEFLATGVSFWNNKLQSEFVRLANNEANLKSKL